MITNQLFCVSQFGLVILLCFFKKKMYWNNVHHVLLKECQDLGEEGGAR